MEAATVAPAERTAVLAFVDTVLIQDDMILKELGSNLLFLPLLFFIFIFFLIFFYYFPYIFLSQPFPTTTDSAETSKSTPPLRCSASTNQASATVADESAASCSIIRFSIAGGMTTPSQKHARFTDFQISISVCGFGVWLQAKCLSLLFLKSETIYIPTRSLFVVLFTQKAKSENL